MFGLVVLLSILLLHRDEKGKASCFFDLENTTCMRGFWCIIILLVHIPLQYQNTIQDAIGSFAYIGVTFFFMTSSYGLLLSVEKNPQAMKNGFWKRRLSKLLIPMVLVNIVRFVAYISIYGIFDWWNLLQVTGFVRQLLFFYLLFWLVFRFCADRVTLNVKCLIVGVGVVLFSILIYITGGFSIFGWPPESMGFLYGVLLARLKEWFFHHMQTRWKLKCAEFCIGSLLLGVFYLKFKWVPFWGDYIVKIFLGLLILLFILVLNTKISIGNPVSRFLGKISYEVYLIHDVSFLILMGLPFQYDSGIFILLSIVVTIMISIGVNWISGKTMAMAKK